MINNNILNLIEEIQKIGPAGRLLAYGPIGAYKLLASRVFNSEVNEYYEEFLEELDKAILFFNGTQYKVNIDRYTLGELYNTSKIHSTNARQFFTTYFETLNLIVLEIIKAGIDEIYDNDGPLQGISSLRGFLKLKYNSTHFTYVKNIISKYYIMVAEKPFDWASPISSLKRHRLDTEFLSSQVVNLETEVINYIKLKYSITDTSVYTVMK